MTRVDDALRALAPALGFLLAGVPLARLLDELGFFAATAAALGRRYARGTPVLGLWLLAALTTVVLNLDTTIVLLTPLYVRIARRSGDDELALALVPLLLACLASSVLPVSNLTTLIAADRLDVGVGAVAGHLGLPTVAAVTIGWVAYRRRHPTTLAAGADEPADQRALRIGGAVVAAVLVGFVFGPAVGVAPWMVATGADLVLVAITRLVPWRDVPATTAVGVAAVAAAVALAIPHDALRAPLEGAGAWRVVGAGVGGATVANVVNNLPALLLATNGLTRMTWPAWGWLLGVNAGAVLFPLGALANLLWLRILRDEGLRVSPRRYVRLTVPIAGPAFLGALVVLAVERFIVG